MLEEMANQSITWTKPTGPEPKWLERGRKRFQAIERIRDLLAREIEPRDIQELPLTNVLAGISEELVIPICFDHSGISSIVGVPSETRITLQFTGNIRTFLDLLLEPYGLTYVISESGLLITNSSLARTKASLVGYDLSFVSSDSKSVKSLVQTIELIIDSYEGDRDCFVSVIDSLLIVAATERSHVEIESLLASLAPAPSTPAESAPESGNKMAPNDKKPDVNDPFGRSNPVGDDPFAF